MKSTIASLRELTLPFGATDGARIVLDGTTGKILLYDQNNTLIMVLNPDSGFPTQDTQNFRLYRDDGTLFLTMDSEPGAGLRLWGNYPDPDDAAAVLYTAGRTTGMALMTRIPGHQIESHAGGIFMDAYDGVGQSNICGLRLATGYPITVHDPLGSAELRLWSPKEDLSQAPFISAEFINLGAVPRPIIDLTNASASAGKEAKVVVNDLWYGTPSGLSGILPTEIQPYPRGMGQTWLAEQTTDVALSAVVGTWTDLITLSNIPVKAGRRYEIICSGWFDWVTGGAGFTVGEVFQFELQRFVGAWAALTHPGGSQSRTNIAAVIRHAMFPVIGYYEPAADATVDFKLRGRKSAGAAGVTCTVATNAGANPGILTCKEVGAY